MTKSRKALAIGIVGGMSPESTILYYQYIVRRHAKAFGDHGYPRIVIASVSFQQFIEWQYKADWREITKALEREFFSLAAAGADFALLATNTMHKVLAEIESPIPVLSILDAVSDFARAAGIRTVGLTGTRFTMSDGFYLTGLQDRGLNVLVPSPREQERLHQIIYGELIGGVVSGSSVHDFAKIGMALMEHGAEAILLACTELQMLAQDEWFQGRTLDSTVIHAEAAWRRSLDLLSNQHSIMSGEAKLGGARCSQF